MRRRQKEDQNQTPEWKGERLTGGGGLTRKIRSSRTLGGVGLDGRQEPKVARKLGATSVCCSPYVVPYLDRSD